MGNTLTTLIGAVVDFFTAGGVGEQVTGEVRALQTWRNAADDNDNDSSSEGGATSSTGTSSISRHEFRFTGRVVRNRRDAVFAVDSLHNHNNNNNNTSSSLNTNKKKSLTLVFEWHDRFESHSVLDVFCEFLHTNPPTVDHLEMHWPIPKQPFRRILEALHGNTSVNEFSFILGDMTKGDADYGRCIATLLQHKNDFEHLHFHDCGFIASIIPGLARPHEHLQSLDFEGKLRFEPPIAGGFHQVNDEVIRLLLEAMIAGDFPAFKGLNLRCNSITSVGLQTITNLLPQAAPNLETLNLAENYHVKVGDNTAEFEDCLLGNETITKEFAKRILSSGAMKYLKEFTVDDFKGYLVHIIKALEHDKASLESLELACNGEFESLVVVEYSRPSANDSMIFHRAPQAICNQLVESIPKMSSLRRLIYRCNEAPPCVSADSGIDTALFRNTSLVEFTIVSDYEDDDPEVTGLVIHANDEFRGRVAPIFHRNRDLWRILAFSQPQPRPQPGPLPPRAATATAITTAITTATTTATATTTSAAATSGTSSDDESTTDTTDAVATTTTTVPTDSVSPVPHCQWSRIVATVGREESPYGATPVFQFLQDYMEGHEGREESTSSTHEQASSTE